MRRLVLEQEAFNDFCDRGAYDRQVFLRIDDLLKAVLRAPVKVLADRSR